MSTFLLKQSVELKKLGSNLEHCACSLLCCLASATSDKCSDCSSNGASEPVQTSFGEVELLSAHLWENLEN